MGNEDYERAYDSAVTEMHRLEKQRQAIEARILHLRQMISAMKALAGIKDDASVQPMPRLTQAIRSIFTAASPTDVITARQIRDTLVRSGFPAQNHQNFLASIHSVLKRLV